MRIIVLGGTGFIGKIVVKRLKKLHFDVFPLSRNMGFDLRDIKLAITYFKEIKPDAIINCAAHVGSVHYVTTYAADVINDNILMAINLYKAIQLSCPEARIINPLSNCSYPGNANIHSEPDWWLGEVHPSVFSYGNSKRFIYVIARCYHKQYNIRSINLLVPNTFGPGDHKDPNKVHALNGMIIRMIQAAKLNSSEFEIWGTGNPIREWAYVDDVVNLLIDCLALDNDLIYPVNLAQNQGFKIKDSAKIIAEILNFQGKLIFNDKYQDGAPFKILDDKIFKSLFPLYKFFDHKEGIRKTVEYYQSIL